MKKTNKPNDKQVKDLKNKPGMIFELTDKQVKKFERWRKKLSKDPDVGAAGGVYTFKFTPTGIGMVEEVERADGHTLSLTDFDTW